MSVALGRGAAAALAVSAVAALSWALIYGGGAEPGALDRVGPVVRWSVPVGELVFNLAAACTAGPLLLALVVLAPHEPAHRRALRFAGCSAVVWAMASGVLAVANFQLIANMPLFAEGFASSFLSFLADDGPGRSGLIVTGITAATAMLCFTVRSQSAIALTAALSFFGLIPLVLNSHAAGGADHADSTMAIVLHSAAAAVWLGGLAGLVVLRPSLAISRLSTVIRRYSTLALLSFILLSVSGVLAAWVSIGSLAQIGTPYGVIVLFKFAAVIALGVFGALYRLWLIPRLGDGSGSAARYFWFLVVVELAVMGAAAGLAASLSRTETPTSLGLAASDEPLPVPSMRSYLSQWDLDPLWSVLCAVAVFVYLAGVVRARSAGVAWPIHKTALWLVGTALLFIVTNGGVHAYQAYLFNMHVMTQMLLTAVIPLFLVMASPLSLAELTVKPRTDGSTGGFEFTRTFLRPIQAAAGGTPYLSALVVAVTFVAFYYTPLLEYSALSQLGYGIMTVLALLSGCVLVTSVTGTPVTGQGALPKRFAAVAGAALVYGMYGQAFTIQADALEQVWYRAVGQPWGAQPLLDAELAGPTMWFLGGISLVSIVLIIVFRRNPEDAKPARTDSSEDGTARPLRAASTR